MNIEGKIISSEWCKEVKKMGREAECPTCSAYIPVDEDVRAGEHIYCSYCGSQLLVTREMLEDDEETGIKKVEVEEDWD